MKVTRNQNNQKWRRITITDTNIVILLLLLMLINSNCGHALGEQVSARKMLSEGKHIYIYTL